METLRWGLAPSPAQEQVLGTDRGRCLNTTPLPPPPGARAAVLTITEF